jgi:hypothetical protein
MKNNNLEQYLEINGCQYLKDCNYMILSSISGHIMNHMIFENLFRIH